MLPKNPEDITLTNAELMARTYDKVIEERVRSGKDDATTAIFRKKRDNIRNMLNSAKNVKGSQPKN